MFGKMKFIFFVVVFHLCFAATLSRRRSRKPRVTETHELTAEDEEFIVNEHNKIRSQVQPPATNMIKLVYNRDLADLARDYSRKCIYEHNPYPFTAEFDYPGDILYVTTGLRSNLTNLMNRAVYLWNKANENYMYDTIQCKKGKMCGQYTEMVWAENTAVGCGVSTCRDLRMKGHVRPRAQLVVCYYGPGGNYYGERPYKTGVTCSECPQNRQCVCGEQ